MARTDVDERKHDVRLRMWSLLDQRRAVVGSSAHGSIPNFVGADAAAARLAQLDAWRTARVIKAVPDKAQQPVRAFALREGKTLYMAVAKLAKEEPFFLLDPSLLGVAADEAASRHVAAQVGQPVAVSEMRPVDLIVCGSVAVNRGGARLGKGAGYSDLEVAFLHDAGLIGPETTIVTTVHPLQVMDDDLPEAEHDFSVDLVVTPDEVVSCEGPQRRPTGLVWEHLSPDKIAAIPVLAAQARRT